MAEKLLQYYKYIAERKGIPGKVELARLTIMPGTVAASQPDSPENIAKFKKAVAAITGKAAPSF